MLTAKQEDFAKRIAEGMNQSDAYRSAYNTSRMTDKSVWEKASELAKDVKVTARVKELRDMAAKSTIMTAQQRKEWLTEVINNPEVDINARLKASDQLNRMDGEYTQKIEANVVNDVTINIELSDD
jgi:phage terminase small subunit